MFYYSHHIGDLIRDTANLDDHQLATYMRMLWSYYDTEKPLENNIEDLAFALRSNEKTVQLLLKHYFKLDGDVWRHTRCDTEIADYHSKKEKASNSAKARWTNAKAMPTNSERNANALKQSADLTVLHANQEPRTKNQEPKKKEKPAPLCVAVSVLLEKGFDVLTAEEFIAHKTKIKAPLTARAWSDHLAESAKAGWTPKAAAEKVMAKNWKGFEAKYVANEAVSSTYEPPYAKYMREKMEQISPSIAAKNPNNPVKKIDPNEFLRTIEAQNVVRIN